MQNCRNCEYAINQKDGIFYTWAAQCSAPIHSGVFPASVCRQNIYADGDKVFFGSNNQGRKFPEKGCALYKGKDGE